MTVSELYSDIDFMCSTTSASYSTTDKLRNMNHHYQDVARIIWESADGWQYDDSNATDFGIATTTLVNAQQDYELPATCQRLQRVEVLDSSGNYVLLKQKDIHDIEIGTSEYFAGGGTPIYYDLIGRSLFLYPAPATGYVTMAAGLKVWFDRDVTALDSVSDTPGFATAFHRILSLGASIDFTRDEVDLSKFLREKDRLEKGLVRFYGKRNVEGQARIQPAGKKRWRHYT